MAALSLLGVAGPILPSRGLGSQGFHDLLELHLGFGVGGEKVGRGPLEVGGGREVASLRSLPSLELLFPGLRGARGSGGDCQQLCAGLLACLDSESWRDKASTASWCWASVLAVLAWRSRPR
jgi:hypothetical protein